MSEAPLHPTDRRLRAENIEYGEEGLRRAVRAGRASDARPWVEVLREGASVPPNVRDCHFRLKPRAQCDPVPRVQSWL